MLAPTPTKADLIDGRAFDAMIRALARPGEMIDTAVSMSELAASLLDLEVTHFAASDQLAVHLASTGSAAAPIGEADYLFYPQMQDEHLRALADVKVGDSLYPDLGATLIVGAGFGEGTLLRLIGPGIAGERTVSVSGLPAGLWSVRERTVVFPLGWDLFLIGEGKLMGLPRSTKVEVL